MQKSFNMLLSRKEAVSRTIYMCDLEWVFTGCMPYTLDWMPCTPDWMSRIQTHQICGCPYRAHRKIRPGLGQDKPMELVQCSFKLL